MGEAISNPSIIAQLFAAAGIRRVVFVDDRFGITTERIEALANELSKTALAGCGAFSTDTFAADNEEVILDKIVKLINADSADLQMMFDKLAAAQYGYGEAERDQKAAKYFQEIIGPTAEVMLLSLKQWEQQKTDLLAQAEATPTLFIFDDDFSLEGKSTKYGRQLIGETHAINHGYKFVYALLTHNAPTDDAEISLEKEIAEHSPDLAEYLLVIAKSRLSDNTDRFAERMKHLLLYRLFRVLTHRLKEETAKASDLAIKQIGDLGVQSFERIILGTSRAEGAWSPDTLVRIIGVYQQQQIRQNIRKDSKLHELVRDINPICDVGTSVMTEGVATTAKQLQHDEIYESGELINTVQLPLASGDIFEDTKGSQYILLGQPCDLMVRSTGLRRSKDRDSRQMVPLAPLRKAESKYAEDLILPPEQYELPHFLAKERWSVRLAETHSLPVWMLDLSVLSAQGRCSLVAGQDTSPLLIDPWRKRLAVLNKRVAAIAASVNKITDESIDSAELLQSYCRIPMGSPFEVELTQEQNGTDSKWSFTFGLTRTSRVTERYATAILIEYAAYLARLAHPHDLTHLETK